VARSPGVPGRARRKIYDRAYFDRWYRRAGTRVHVAASVARKVRFAVHAAELLIERPIRSVLDVGCGEGAWLPHLHRLRPGVRYAGVDSSAYAVRRFGRSRNVRLGTFGGLAQVGLEGRYDLVVCSDVLHYVPTPEIAPGLAALTERVGGVAFLEVFTSADDTEGDQRGHFLRSPAWYARAFRRAGLVHCGLYCFVRRDFAPGLTALERGRL
jgi:SAM-dependent methyltransferase